ncbi:hypothetical protein Tco_1457057 [Tanacetum coccineum]
MYIVPDVDTSAIDISKCSADGQFEVDDVNATSNCEIDKKKGTFETSKEARSETPGELRLRLAYKEAAIFVLAFLHATFHIHSYSFLMGKFNTISTLLEIVVPVSSDLCSCHYVPIKSLIEWSPRSYFSVLFYREVKVMMQEVVWLLLP